MPFYRFKKIGTEHSVDVICRIGLMRLNQTVGGTGYSGRCSYDVDAASEMLSIHELYAIPEAQGLGTLFLFCAALEGFAAGATKVETTATARDAYGFYLGLGFHPEKVRMPSDANDSPPVFDVATEVGKTQLEERIRIGRTSIATWRTELRIMKRLAEEKMASRWEYQQFFA